MEGDEGVEGAGAVNTGDGESDSGSGDRIDVGSADKSEEGVVGNVGGGKQSEDVEGGTPTDEGMEGEIPVDKVTESTKREGYVEEEIPEELEVGERKEEIVDGDDDEEEGTEKVDMDVDESELSDGPELIEGTKFIMVPDEGPEAEDMPATARTNQ